jgi:hypothetical protein
LTTFEEAESVLGDKLDVGKPDWMSWDSPVWLVRLSGRWQSVGGPAPEIQTTTTPNLPVPTPVLYDLCEVLLDPNMDMETFYLHLGWKEASP